jgi:hypothetical protein
MRHVRAALNPTGIGRRRSPDVFADLVMVLVVAVDLDGDGDLNLVDRR